MVELSVARSVLFRIMEISSTNMAKPTLASHTVPGGNQFRQADGILVAWDVFFPCWRIPCGDDFEPILWLQDSFCSDFGVLCVVVGQNGYLAAHAVSQWRAFRGQAMTVRIDNVMQLGCRWI